MFLSFLFPFTVKKNAPYFYIAPSPVTVSRLLTARLDCVVLGDPIPTVQWLRNDNLLTNSMKYKILTNGSLLVLNTELSDEGEFKCVGSNLIASIQSNSVRLTVACKSIYLFYLLKFDILFHFLYYFLLRKCFSLDLNLLLILYFRPILVC